MIRDIYPTARVESGVGVAAEPAVEALGGEAALLEQPLLRRERHHLLGRRLGAGIERWQQRRPRRVAGVAADGGVAGVHVA